jgi:hypothetical protein
VRLCSKLALSLLLSYRGRRISFPSKKGPSEAIDVVAEEADATLNIEAIETNLREVSLNDTGSSNELASYYPRNIRGAGF